MTLKQADSIVAEATYTITIHFAQTGEWETIHLDYTKNDFAQEKAILRKLEIMNMKTKVKHITVNSVTEKLDISVDVK